MNQTNQNQRQWVPIGGGSNNARWKPQERQPYNPNDPNNVIMGYFTGTKEFSGPNGPFIVSTLTMVNPDKSLGDDIDISGGKVLDDKLSDIPLNSFVCIKYGGKVPSKTPGRMYNVWEVFMDQGAIPYNQLPGAVNHQPAEYQQPAAPTFQPYNPATQPAPSFQPAAQPQVTPKPFVPPAQPAPSFQPAAPAQQAAQPTQINWSQVNDNDQLPF